MAEKRDGPAPTCENCRFYFFGFCRRYPPTVLINPVEDEETVSEWPTVETEDWCGEHQVRREREDRSGS